MKGIIIALTLALIMVLVGGAPAGFAYSDNITALEVISDNTTDNVTHIEEIVTDNITTDEEIVTDNSTSGNATGMTPEYYTLVVLPDTQNYSSFYPGIFERQTQWIVDNREAENIVYVAHVGDIVNHADNQAEWGNAILAMNILSDNGTLYITTVGNHDISLSTGLQPYNDAFGNDAFGFARNYALFNIGNTGCIIIAINTNAGGVLDADVKWAEGILKQYEDRVAIVLVHEFLWERAITKRGFYAWEHLVEPSHNVFLVLCGHALDEVWRASTTDNGTLVNILLANYQHFENGGNGWLRLYRFNASMTEIEVKTYSPYLDLYRSNPESEFTVDLVNSKAPPPLLPAPPVPAPTPASTPSNGGGGGGGGFMPGEIGMIISISPTSNPDLFIVRMISEHTGLPFQRLLTKEEVEELQGEWKGVKPCTPEALVKAAEYEPPPFTLEPVIPQPIILIELLG